MFPPNTEEKDMEKLFYRNLRLLRLSADVVVWNGGVLTGTGQALIFICH